MRGLTLAKSDVCFFLQSLAPDYRVLTPHRVSASDFVFDDHYPGSDIPWDFVNTLLPPKTLFFPQRETLFRIEGGKRPNLLPNPPERPLALFGLRSCDATALLFFEKFWGERGFDDDGVTGRIRSSLRMALSCSNPGPNCFCVCCDGGPFLTSGFDLQFLDLGERLLVEPGTARGEETLRRTPALFGPASPDDLLEKQRRVANVDVAFNRRSYISDGMKRLSLQKIPDEFWEACAADCQGCGGCCFVCPTCSCFSVTDKTDGADRSRRERWKDSCLYEGFTREASGHNPRARKAERVKRRLFHKLSYQYVEKMGRHGCVGCGRCVTTCMGRLGIPDFLERLRHECK